MKFKSTKDAWVTYLIVFSYAVFAAITLTLTVTRMPWFISAIVVYFWAGILWQANVIFKMQQSIIRAFGVHDTHIKLVAEALVLQSQRVTDVQDFLNRLIRSATNSKNPPPPTTIH
jgi:hypothetical protein